MWRQAQRSRPAHSPGPENIKFPSDYLKGVLYQTLDRPDSKQTLVQWSVEQDAGGVPLKGPDGRFIKKEITGHTVMEKRQGFGADYPADWPRNGEWEYAVFTADGRPNPKGNTNNKA